MPTERFYRLPSEKADIIRMAAIKEFTRARYEEASINRIIQDADISRGSFYTYFEDKKDLLEWLIQDVIKGTQKYYVQVYQENGGDIWDLFDRSLDYQINRCSQNGLAEFFGNLMKSGVAGELFHLEMDPHDRMQESGNHLIEWLFKQRDQEKCPLNDAHAFQDLVVIHMISIMLAVKQRYKDHRPLEEVKATYKRRMQMIRYGVEDLKHHQD